MAGSPEPRQLVAALVRSHAGGDILDDNVIGFLTDDMQEMALGHAEGLESALPCAVETWRGFTASTKSDEELAACLQDLFSELAPPVVAAVAPAAGAPGGSGSGGLAGPPGMPASWGQAGGGATSSSGLSASASDFVPGVRRQGGGGAAGGGGGPRPPVYGQAAPYPPPYHPQPQPQPQHYPGHFEPAAYPGQYGGGRQWAPVARGRPAEAGIGGEDGQLPQPVVNDAMAILVGEFPTFGPDTLQGVLDDCGGDLEAAMMMLDGIQEAESYVPPAPSMDESSFPSLAGGPRIEWMASTAERTAPTNGAPLAGAGGGGHGSPGWAGKAKATAGTPPPAPPVKRVVEADEELLPRPSQGKLKSAYRGPEKKGATSVIPWVQTGSQVTADYAKSRADAGVHARARNQYFEQATRAYAAGNKAAAKELGRKGREQSRLMKAAHEQAASSKQVFSTTHDGTRMVDLHGLHVKEALSYLDQLSGGRKGERQVVFIVVGTGHHSHYTKKKNVESRLATAVEGYLSSRGIAYSSPQPGLLRATLKV